MYGHVQGSTNAQQAEVLPRIQTRRWSPAKMQLPKRMARVVALVSEIYPILKLLPINKPANVTNVSELPMAIFTGPNMSSVQNHGNQSNHATLMALGGGIGASLGATGSRSDDLARLHRVRCQDTAVLLILTALYFVALGFSASIMYRQAMNNSPVTYFCKPLYAEGGGVMSGHSIDNFVETFNQVPKTSLQISGFEPIPGRQPPQEVGDIWWQGESFRSVFALSFDLSPWMIHDITAGSVGQVESSRVDGISADDLGTLEYFLAHDSNDLAYVEISKETSWPGWEELATNIKQTIRQQGFTGVVSVRLKEETVRVQKNTAWANFMHARTTFMLCSFSIAGLFVYFPYKWLRCKKIAVRSRHRVNVSTADYWPYIADKLSVETLRHDQTR